MADEGGQHPKADAAEGAATASKGSDDARRMCREGKMLDGETGDTRQTKASATAASDIPELPGPRRQSPNAAEAERQEGRPRRAR